MQDSKITGVLHVDEDSVFHRIKKERFLQGTLTVNSMEIPIVLSEHFLRYNGKRVSLTGQIATRFKHGFFTYFNTTFVEETTAEDNATVYVEGVVKILRPFTPNRTTGANIYLSLTSDDNYRKRVIHVNIFDALAREYHTLEDGIFLSGEGTISVTAKAFTVTLNHVSKVGV